MEVDTVFEYDDLYTPSTTVEFHFSSGLLTTKVRLDEPYLFTEEQWMEMVNAARNKTKLYFNCYGGNGEGSMQCDGENMIFVAQPSGAGGDVLVQVKVPINEQCIQALMKVVESPEMQRVWNHMKLVSPKPNIVTLPKPYIAAFPGRYYPPMPEDIRHQEVERDIKLTQSLNALDDDIEKM